MSEPTRITRDELEASLSPAHRAAAPGEPGAAALDRVRAIAEATAREREARPRLAGSRPLALRLAAAAAVTLAVFGVSLAVVRPGNLAFARDRLLEALAPQGSVLHYTQAVTSIHTDADGREESTGTFEHWIDAGNQRRRSEGSTPGLGVTYLEIESGGRLLSGVPASGLIESPTASLESTATGWQITEIPTGSPYWDSPDGFNPFYQLDMLRQAVADRDAKVVGSVTVDGEECWEVEWRIDLGADDAPGEPESLAILSAAFRKSDYRPMRTSTVTLLDGEVQERFDTEVTTWELLPSDEVDEGLFDRWNLSRPVSAENRTYSPQDLPDFQAFDAWWLGAEYDGRTLNGSIALEGAGTAPMISYQRGTGTAGTYLPFARDGVLTMTYAVAGAYQSNPTDIQVAVMFQQPEEDLEACLRDLPTSSIDPAMKITDTEFTWRQVDGRRYVERLETWVWDASAANRKTEFHDAESAADATEPPASGTSSVALLNLGDATVLVRSSDADTTRKAIAALVKAN